MFENNADVNNKPYPWQQESWDQLAQQLIRQRLPHALLLQGSSGGGLDYFAKFLSKTLLCENIKNTYACNQCRSCHLFEVGNHPNFRHITPEESDNGKISKVIKIDQIRQVLSSVQQTALQGGRKVLIISPAEAMNNSAANALLKNLEEPPRETFFILLSVNPARLMATIRSRCQQVDISEASLEQADEWLSPYIKDKAQRTRLLQLSNNNPLQVKQWQDENLIEPVLSLEDELIQVQEGGRSIFELASNWQKNSVLQRLGWWWNWLALLIKENTLQDKNASKSQLLFMDQLLACKQQLESTANPNEQLMLESLLIGWQKLPPIKNRH